jgi:hypothetical protein
VYDLQLVSQQIQLIRYRVLAQTRQQIQLSPRRRAAASIRTRQQTQAQPVVTAVSSLPSADQASHAECPDVEASFSVIAATACRPSAHRCSV